MILHINITTSCCGNTNTKCIETRPKQYGPSFGSRKANFKYKEEILTKIACTKVSKHLSYLKRKKERFSANEKKN
jgi:hypothetical protein